MKEEYKIWDEQLKSWVGNPNLWTIDDMNSSNYSSVQYVGIRDKENKKIYEKDIVKVYDKIGIVLYDEGTTSYKIYHIKNDKLTNSWCELSYRTVPYIKVKNSMYEDKMLKEIL